MKKALTIKQPWVHAILHQGKDIENRSWPGRAAHERYPLRQARLLRGIFNSGLTERAHCAKPKPFIDPGMSISSLNANQQSTRASLGSFSSPEVASSDEISFRRERALKACPIGYHSASLLSRD
jgi:hypothetical protein